MGIIKTIMNMSVQKILDTSKINTTIRDLTQINCTYTRTHTLRSCLTQYPSPAPAPNLASGLSQFLQLFMEQFVHFCCEKKKFYVSYRLVSLTGDPWHCIYICQLLS